MGRHTVDHMQQGPRYTVRSRIIKQDTRAMGLKQDLGSGKKKRKELKPGMLSY